MTYAVCFMLKVASLMLANRLKQNPEVSINTWMKNKVLLMCSVSYYSAQKRKKLFSQCIETTKHYANWKKPAITRHIVYDSHTRKFRKRSQIIGSECKLVISQGLKEGEVGLMNTDFLFVKIKKFWQWIILANFISVLSK